MMKDEFQKSSKQKVGEIEKTTRNLPHFVLLTFLISLPILILAFLTTHMVPEDWPINHFGFMSIIAPVTAASILTYRENGLDGAKDFLQRSFDHKRIAGKKRYGMILFSLPIIYVSSQLLMTLFEVQIPEKPVSIAAILVTFPFFMLFALCEEVGWQGYAYDPLEKRWNSLNASIILGTIMAVWHLPLFIIQHPPGGSTWIAGQSLNIVATRILIVWIFNDTGKSVFSAILLHAIYNVCTMYLPFYGTPLGPMFATVVTAIVVICMISARGLRNRAGSQTPELTFL